METKERQEVMDGAELICKTCGRKVGQLENFLDDEEGIYWHTSCPVEIGARVDRYNSKFFEHTLSDKEWEDD